MVMLIVDDNNLRKFRVVLSILKAEGFDNQQPELLNPNKGTILMAGVDEANRAIEITKKYNIQCHIKE